jgi:hypothetical protein
MKGLMLLIIFCIAAISSSAISQDQDRLWTVITASEDTLLLCALDHIDNGRIQLACGNAASHVSVDSVRKIIRHVQSQFWKSAGYGALGGAAAGAIIGLASYQRPRSGGFISLDYGPGFSAAGGAILGAVAGFAVGGIVGAASGGDEVHDLTSETFAEKLRILKHLAAEDE